MIASGDVRYFVVVSEFAEDGQTSTVPLSQLAADVGPHVIVTRGGTSTAVVLPKAGRVVIGRARTADVPLDDPGLSRAHIAIDVGDHLSLVDLGSSNGTVLSGRAIAPNTPALLRPNDLIEIGTTLLLVQGVPRDNASQAVGRRARAFAVAERVASTELNVLVTGPAGAGKAFVVDKLRAKLRAPLVAVQCGRLTRASLASITERKPAALLLQHVDATPRTLQGKLLSLIESQQPRVFATSRADLDLAARRLEFYAQLLAVLRQVHIEMPALHECGDELEVLAAELVGETARDMALRRVPTLTEEALQALRSLPYPDNARSLRSIVQRAVASTADASIGAAEIQEIASAGPGPEDREEQRILDALAACAGNQTQAAKRLGMSRRTFVSRLDKYGIVRPRKPK